MTLVERFIDFRDWPASRKTARAGVPLVAGLLLGIGFLVWARPEAVDIPMLTRLVWCGLVLACVTAAIAWVADRRGTEGRWTAYLMAVAVTAWLWVGVYIFGYFATPFVALPMMLGLFAALWFEARVAFVSLIWGIVLSALCAVATFADGVPFAPAMAVRDIDGLRSTSWFLSVGSILIGLTLLVYMLALVTIAAADLQTRRLERGHGLIRRYVPAQVARCHV